MLELETDHRQERPYFAQMVDFIQEGNLRVQDEFEPGIPVL